MLLRVRVRVVVGISQLSHFPYWNSACYHYWVECLHLVFSCAAGETCNTGTVSTAVTHWNWVEQTVLIYIEWNVCILSLVGETHNASTAASTVIHWKWCDILSKKHFCCKKGKAKLLNDLKMWYHCEAKKKRYQLGCVYRTPAYEVNSF